MANPFERPLQQVAPEEPANPFAAKMAPVPMAEQETSVPSSFMDKVDIFNRGFERYALGGLQMLNNVPVLGRALPTDEQLAAKNAQSEANYQQAYARTPSPVVDFLGRTGGAITAATPAAMATTTAGPAGLVGAVGQGAATGAMSGLMDYSENTSDRLEKGLIGGAVGGAFGAAAFGAGQLFQAISPKIGASSFVKKFFQPKAAAVDDIASAIKTDYAGNIPRALDDIANAPAGATPGEALGKGASQVGVLRNQEASIPLDASAKQSVSENIIPRVNDAKKGIYEAIGRMGTPKVKQAKSDAFAAMNDEFISPDGSLVKGAPVSTNYVPEFIKENPILSTKYAEVANAQSKAISSLPDNSVAKLHQVEASIKMDLFNAVPNPKTGIALKALEPDEKMALIEAQRAIRPILEQSDEYSKAMAASSSLEKHNYYQELIKTKKADAGAKGSLSLDQVFDTVIPQKMRQQQFIKAVTDTGGDPTAVRQLVDIADSLRKAPLWETLKGNKIGGQGLNGGNVSMIKQFVSDLTMDRYYKAMLDITLSGDKWKPMISEVLKAESEQAQQIGFLSLLKEAVKQSPRGAVNAIGVDIGRQVTE